MLGRIFAAVRQALAGALRCVVWVFEAGEWTLRSILSAGAPPPIPEPPMEVPEAPSAVEQVAARMERASEPSPARTLLLYAGLSPSARDRMPLDPGMRRAFESLDAFALARIAKLGLREAERVIAEKVLAQQADPVPSNEDAGDRLLRKYGRRRALVVATA